MSHKVAIQPMTPGDLDPVCNVWEQSGLSIADYDRERYELTKLMEWNPDTCLVAKHGGEIVGTAIGASNGRRVWIYHLAVLPAWQGQGIGSALLNTIEKKVSSQGATKILLGVGLDNLAVVPFYEKQGFRVMMDMMLFQKDFYKKGGVV